MQTNSILTRGLGGPLLVTRGLGLGFIIEIVSRPRQLRRHGGSGRRDEVVNRFKCVVIKARLISINGIEAKDPSMGTATVDCQLEETVRVRGILSETKRRRSQIVIRARHIRDVDF